MLKFAEAEKQQMENNIDKRVGYWLLIGAIMVMSMVVIGGITRLTHSGLSMVDWKPISGTLPPMNEAEWSAEFENYKSSPEFQKINSHFTLEDFKGIFFWEYFHRLIGRVIGIVFIVPFLYFLFTKKLENRTLRRNLILIFFLGGLQGLIGWYMVKSGLVNNPAVSHYRLALHLSTALLLICCILWTALSVFYPRINREYSEIRKPLLLLLPVVAIQIIYGAFVAGLKAGYIFPSYPKMGPNWIAPGIGQALESEGFISLIGNPLTVQFIHRWFAIIVVLLVGYIFIKGRKLALDQSQQNINTALISMVGVQFLLGVFTLINAVPVSLGVLHQLGAAVLLSIVITGIYFNSFQIKKAPN